MIGPGRQKLFGVVILLVLFFLPARACSAVLSARLEGTVGVAMEAFVEDVLERASVEKSDLVVFHLDTPGGLVSSMRTIVSRILESPVPVVVWVAPQGARAASAGPSCCGGPCGGHGPRDQHRSGAPRHGFGEGCPVRGDEPQGDERSLCPYAVSGPASGKKRLPRGEDGPRERLSFGRRGPRSGDSGHSRLGYTVSPYGAPWKVRHRPGNGDCAGPERRVTEISMTLRRESCSLSRVLTRHTSS